MKRLMLVLLVMVMTIAWSVTAFADSNITYSENTLLTNDVTLTIEPATETQVYKVEVKWSIINGYYKVANNAVSWDEESANWVVNKARMNAGMHPADVQFTIRNLSTPDIAYMVGIELSPYDSNSKLIDTISDLDTMALLGYDSFATNVKKWNDTGKKLPANDRANLGEPDKYYTEIKSGQWFNLPDTDKIAEALVAHYATSGSAFSDSSYHDKYTLTITPVTNN